MNVPSQPFFKLKLDDMLEMNLDSIINESQLGNDIRKTEADNSSEESIELPCFVKTDFKRSIKTVDNAAKLNEIALSLEKRKSPKTYQYLDKPSGDTSSKVSRKNIAVVETKAIKTEPAVVNKFKSSPGSIKNKPKPLTGKNVFKITLKTNEPLKMLPNKFKEITEQAKRSKYVGLSNYNFFRPSKAKSTPKSLTTLEKTAYISSNSGKTNLKLEPKNSFNTRSSSKYSRPLFTSSSCSFRESRKGVDALKAVTLSGRSRTNNNMTRAMTETKKSNTQEKVNKGFKVNRISQ